VGGKGFLPHNVSLLSFLASGLDSKHPSGVQSTVSNPIDIPILVSKSGRSGMEEQGSIEGDRNEGKLPYNVLSASDLCPYRK